MRVRIFASVAAISVALGGYLHLQIWRGGYQFAPVKEMFLLNVGISGAVAVALLLHPRKLTAAAGLLLSFGSLAAFALSRGPGLPTLHGTFKEMALAPHNVRFLGGPAALPLLVAEGLAMICCIVVLASRRNAPAPATSRASGFRFRPVAA
ncbi:MAG: hypothetical protein QOF30_2206 [Acidimicrobiaceae bacterium]|jgi:hypothetical protein|nr:hypothetical protein [Acidimicrobiaceae bacterium]